MNLEKIAEDIFRDAINYISKNKCTIGELRRYVGDKIRSRGLRLSFPVCISIGNCIGFNCEDSEKIIQEDDLCKIEFGLTNIQTSENFYFGKTRSSSGIVNALEDIYKSILKEKDSFECTDDLRLFIEGKCAEADLVPIKNCISFQQDDENGCGYFYLNYTPEYDTNDYLTNLENLNFDINRGDRFDINITVLEDDNDNDDNIKYNHKIITNSGHVGNIFKILPDINNSHRNLKLKSSRMLYNLVKKQYLYDAFHFNSLDLNGSNLSILGAKMGLRECIEKDLFEEFPISWVKDTPVYFRKFTITF